MDHFFDEPHMGENWFTYPPLYQYMVQVFPSGSHFVEIGSWKGMSAAFMGVEIVNSGKDIKFDCIDIWADIAASHMHPAYTGDQLYDIFLQNVKPVSHIINPVRCDSKTASMQYADKSVDFVFIDGDHTYEGCKTDIISWLPKMKPNSIMAGHDYGWTPGIRQAVADVFGEGNYSDPWGTGCFILQIEDGAPKRFMS